MSKLWCTAWLTEPAPRNRPALKNAWVKRWNSAAVHAPDAERHHHVAELAHRRVGQHLLDVALYEREAGTGDGGHRADQRHEVDARSADGQAVVEDAVHPGDHEDARDDHGRCVDERRHRGRAGHGVGQPRVQEELARLRHDRAEQADGRDQQRQMADLTGVGHLVDLDDVEGATGAEVQDAHPDEQAHVADAVGEERLERGIAVGLVLPPMTDEDERTDADQLPRGDEHQRVLGDDQRQHRRREQAQEREEVDVAHVAVDVVGGVDVHQQRDRRDDEEHHHG